MHDQNVARPGPCSIPLPHTTHTPPLPLAPQPPPTQAKPQNALPSSLILSGALHETHGSQKKNNSQTKHFYSIC